ncbi:MAG: very short patch repair endonuclease [Atopobiaceae bacterium]|jgi:DNA mismatch endonuclease (patch repair protein)|nr:very short patch repair endonuclease [Atopobiaceae bacterium]
MTSLATRHVMQANKGRDTKPELAVRRALRAAGWTGYRLQWKVAGRPDICFPGRKVAIFVNGCFWHRCPHCGLPLPKSNVEYWEEKFDRNRARDERNESLLVAQGWTVIVVWECRLKKARFAPTIREVVLELERSREGGARVGRVVEVGGAAARARRRALKGYRSRHRGRTRVS